MSQTVSSDTEPREVYIADRATWRQWLMANADSAPGFWLVYDKGSNRRLTDEDIMEEALCFGWVDSKVRRKSESQSMLYLAPRSPKSSRSRWNKQHVERLIAAKLMQPRGLALIETAKANGAWTALDLVEQLVEPVDLVVALDVSSDARRHWNAFPPSARRALLAWIDSAKRPPTRANRIRATVEEAQENRRAIR